VSDSICPATDTRRADLVSARPCPACDRPLEPWFEKDGLAFGRCTGCGGGFADVPRGEPARYHDYLPDLTRTLPDATRNRYRELLRSFEPFRRTGRLLDVGCGGGFFVGEAAAAGWDAAGTEVSAAAVEFGRGRGWRLHRGVVADAGLAPGSLDVLTLFEVIEHVRDPAGLLRECAGVLRPGGLLYLSTPNMGSLSRRLLGADWSVISRDHVSLHTAAALRAVCARAGLGRPRIASRNILPHEVARAFRRKGAAPAAGGSPMRETVTLQARIEARAHLRLLKGAVNAILRATGLGDTLVLRAVRPDTPVSDTIRPDPRVPDTRASGGTGRV